MGALQLAVPQPREAGPQGDQPAVVVHQPVEAAGPAPAQLVDGSRGAVAVVQALFGAGKLLARQHEGGAHAGQVDAGGQPVLGQDDVGGGGVVRFFVFDGHQLIPQSQIVVGRHIADDLAGGAGVDPVLQAPGPHRRADVPEGVLPALHIAGAARLEAVALDGVPGVVAEHPDPGAQHLEVGLVGLIPAQHTLPALPGLAVHQDLLAPRQLIQRGADLVHGVHVEQAHQVEAEAVDVVLFGPVEDRVDHIAAGHGPLAAELAPAAAAVGQGAVRVLAEEIIRDGVVQDVLVAVHMVVHHVHHHADARLVEGGHHLLELLDPHFAVVGVGGIAALGDIIVGGVVPPVVLQPEGPGLVHAAKVEHRHQLHMADAQAAQVVQAGGTDVVPGQGGALLGKGQVFAPPRPGEPAVRVPGKVPDAHLPDHPPGGGDHRPSVELPARRVGAAQVHDHAADAVHPRRPGVGVARLPHLAVHPHRKGVVKPVLVPGQVDGPAAVLPPFHGQRADAKALVPLAVKVDHHLLGRGGPQPQPGALTGIIGAERAVIEVFLLKPLAVIVGPQALGGLYAHCPHILTVTGKKLLSLYSIL